MPARETIYVIDNDAAIRHGLRHLLTAAGFRVETFASAAGFLADPVPKEGCLIVDVGMPDVNWLKFRIELARQNHHLAVLVISGHDDMPKVIGAMRASAMDFIGKPLDGNDIVASVRRALDMAGGILDPEGQIEAAKASIAHLTARERMVAEEIAIGKSNKTVAAELGISERTVEVHRAHILRKLDVRNTSHLVRLVLASWGFVPKEGFSPASNRGRQAPATRTHD